ncbi:MAG: Gfo/Idh/MocA family oxidoreductase [Deltaproteobacteria bacterium]|nr:Gfo/Idh/MocA family oxidoreductase [Deltaproteobacteria bacterium]
MKIALFGAGLIGKKRGVQLGDHELLGLHDPDHARADSLAKDLKAKVFDSEDALLATDAEIAIVAVTNHQLAPLAQKCLRAGKHLLLEKPAAMSVDQLDELVKAAALAKRAVKVGFNHRFHPAVLKMRELVDAGKLGPLMFLRARYGHGGRLGMEKEWRMNAQLSGGGELLDQGVHLLDLTHSFFGPLPLQSSFVTTSYWDTQVDDNAVLTLAGEKTWATFHVSCSEWKNTFSLELYGRAGKAHISGLGGSYGKERLTYYKMLPQLGPPEAEVFDFDAADRSWQLDLQNLVDHISKKSPLLGDLSSARYCLERVREAYVVNGFKGLPCSV